MNNEIWVVEWHGANGSYRHTIGICSTLEVGLQLLHSYSKINSKTKNVGLTEKSEIRHPYQKDTPLVRVELYVSQEHMKTGIRYPYGSVDQQKIITDATGHYD